MSGGRVLMIAHHFPPAGGSGPNRALAFARYLPEFGWDVNVVTPEVAWATNRDDGLLTELPSQARVIRTVSLEPRPRSTPRVRIDTRDSPKRSHHLRSHVGHLKRFPDSHIGWLPFALAAARREHYEVAYSSSGPFTSHVVGLVLKRLTKRPWVAELRDGWYRWNRAIFPDYPAWRDRLERRLEKAALRTADRVVLVTERMAQAFRCQFSDLPPGHFRVVSNGFDPAQFGPPTPPKPHPGWQVVHAGALYHGRSVRALLQAANQVIDDDPNFKRDFHLTLLGSFDAHATAELSASQIEVRGQVDHATALQAMRDADALLLVANTTPGAEATVPGKLFEYLAVGRPVIAIAPRESSTADVLAQTGGGWLAPADDTQAIACVLRRAYAERAVELPRARLERFDRRVLAGELARIFDEVQDSDARRI